MVEGHLGMASESEHGEDAGDSRASSSSDVSHAPPSSASSPERPSSGRIVKWRKKRRPHRHNLLRKWRYLGKIAIFYAVALALSGVIGYACVRSREAREVIHSP
jgi:hypothetical protein